VEPNRRAHTTEDIDHKGYKLHPIHPYIGLRIGGLQYRLCATQQTSCDGVERNSPTGQMQHERGLCRHEYRVVRYSRLTHPVHVSIRSHPQHRIIHLSYINVVVRTTAAKQNETKKSLIGHREDGILDQVAGTKVPLLRKYAPRK
jgi:hypothetical protein